MTDNMQAIDLNSDSLDRSIAATITAAITATITGDRELIERTFV